jgi:hypothetical protein
MESFIKDRLRLETELAEFVPVLQTSTSPYGVGDGRTSSSISYSSIPHILGL